MDRNSPWHDQEVDLLLDSGNLRVQPDKVPKDAIRLKAQGLCVSPGWVDIGAAFGEPGHEERETVKSVLAAAATGGFTRILALPQSKPAVDDRSDVLAIQRLAMLSGLPVHMHVIGSLSQKQDGKDLSEMADMASVGVRVFGDGIRAIDDPKLLQLALAYLQPLDAVVWSQAGQKRLEGQGQIHEGRISTLMGLPGLPDIAEVMGLQRDLLLLEYRGGKMHVPAVSLEETLKIVKEARKRLPGLTYGIAVLNLLLDDSALQEYDVNAKVYPPLRENKDRQALRKAILEGNADVLMSLHQPLDLESKRVEFPYADFGAATLEIAFGIARTAVDDAATVVDYFGIRNRAWLGLEPMVVQDAAQIELTFFAPDETFTAPAQCLNSMGANPAVAGMELKGLAKAIYSQGQWLDCQGSLS